MWAFDHYCRHLSDSETTGQKESLWQIGPPEHKWEIFVSYRKHHLVDSPYIFIASYCCIKQHLSLIITLQIIFKLSQKHSMCQAGESPDNECQYHYHNFNVAIFHPLTTQTFVFLNSSQQNNQQKWIIWSKVKQNGENIFFSHTQGSHIWYLCPNPHSGNDFCVSFAFAWYGSKMM